MGQYDLSMIDVLGETIAAHQTAFTLHSSINNQLNGMNLTPRDADTQ